MSLNPVIIYIIPIASIFISYILGRYQSQTSYKKDVLKQRYESFYVPYIKLLYAHSTLGFSFSDLDPNLRKQYNDIIITNLEYIDHDTQNLYSEFETSYAVLYAFEKNNTISTDAKIQADKIFTRFTICVLTESTKISKKLSLPQISKSIEKFYYQQDHK